MIYVTTRQRPVEKQISWLDLIEEDDNIFSNKMNRDGDSGTVTRLLPEATEKLLKNINVPGMIEALKRFNEYHKDLFEKDRRSMYRRFYIPKRSGGGMRPIDAPCDELQNALEELRIMLNEKFGVLYHTSAFAYVPKRWSKQLLEKHQMNSSNWIYSTDISGFFPSTTLEYLMHICGMIFPLSEICKVEEGRKELEKALSLAFLNSVLPQGTVISPFLSNVAAIPIDHKIFNDLAHKRFVYTRYADDIFISCVQSFNPDKMTKYIQNVFKEFGAPWILKPEKTHYGSRKGKNYMLGLCLNGENNITVGWKNKKIAKVQLCNLIMDYKNKKRWPLSEVLYLEGILAYYKQVESECFNNMIKHYEEKFHVEFSYVLRCMKSMAS